MRVKALALLGALVLVASAAAAGSDYELVLRGGRVIDPESGLDAVRNVGVRDGRDPAVSAEPLDGDRSLDVSGLVVAPGFIDLHTHSPTPLGQAYQARDGVTSLPAATWSLGVVIFVPGAAILTWSMVVNPFFEKTVRIQTDRGHRVVDAGPYSIVRHPGYVGFIGWSLGIPLLLGSRWAFVPASLAVIGLALRTALEDRTLRAELAGYPEYAERVRFRLLPGVW